MAVSDRISALALVAVLTAAWMIPCLLCERAVDHSPGVVARASCHAARGDASAACAPRIRAVAPALRAPVEPVVPAAALATADPSFALDAPVPGLASVRLAPRAANRAPLYLLHASLLA